MEVEETFLKVEDIILVVGTFLKVVDISLEEVDTYLREEGTILEEVEILVVSYQQQQLSLHPSSIKYFRRFHLVIKVEDVVDQILTFFLLHQVGFDREVPCLSPTINLLLSFLTELMHQQNHLRMASHHLVKSNSTSQLES